MLLQITYKNKAIILETHTNQPLGSRRQLWRDRYEKYI